MTPSLRTLADSDRLAREIATSLRMAVPHAALDAARSRIAEIRGGPPVCVVLAREDRTIELQLDPATSARASWMRTRRVAISHHGPSIAPADAAVARAFADCIRDREDALSDELVHRWTLLERAHRFLHDVLPLETFAVCTGVKPAVRRVVTRASLADLERVAAARGLLVEAVPAARFIQSFASTTSRDGELIAYLALTRAALQSARDAEARMIVGEPDAIAIADAIGALGRALGYPSCCIEAFISRRDLPNAALWFDAYAHAPRAIDYGLNAFDPSLAAVSHFVCRHDCSASRGIAATVLRNAARVDAEVAAAANEDLRGNYLLVRDAGWLRLDGLLPVDAAKQAFRYSSALCAREIADVALDRAAQRGDSLRLGDTAIEFHRGNDACGTIPVGPESARLITFA